MKRFLEFSMVVVLLTMVSACLFYQYSSRSSRSDEKADYYLEKKELSKELTNLQKEINRNIKSVGKKVQVVSEESREEVSKTYYVLLKKRKEIEKVLTTVNNAPRDAWSDVKSSAVYTLDDAKSVCMKLEKNMLTYK